MTYDRYADLMMGQNACAPRSDTPHLRCQSAVAAAFIALITVNDPRYRADKWQNAAIDGGVIFG